MRHRQCPGKPTGLPARHAEWAQHRQWASGSWLGRDHARSPQRWPPDPLAGHPHRAVAVFSPSPPTLASEAIHAAVLICRRSLIAFVAQRGSACTSMVMACRARASPIGLWRREYTVSTAIRNWPIAVETRIAVGVVTRALPSMRMLRGIVPGSATTILRPSL